MTATTDPSPPFLSVEHLSVRYPVHAGVLRHRVGWVKAVDDVSFAIARPGEALGLAGESGCGKSSLARALLRLIEPAAGRVVLEGTDITALGPEELRRRRRDVQIVFQDPYWSLNPRMKVEDIVAEPLEASLGWDRRRRLARAHEVLEAVGLRHDQAYRYPHEFSGGQRQRIGIARALSVQPRLVVLDEPTSSLDVSVQAQILNLLQELQATWGLTYLFVSHDLGVMRHLCQRVVVMYLGRIVEMGEADVVFSRPVHPYTQALLAAVPEPDPAQREGGMILQGQVPSPAHRPTGCVFQTRCPLASARCREEEPSLRSLSGGDHAAACHFVEIGG